MFRFENIDLLWALLLIPVMIVSYIIYNRWRKNGLRKLVSLEIEDVVVPDITTAKPTFKFALLTLAVIGLILGLANPQIGTKLEEVKREGIEVIVALDLSNSMTAEDLAPNRLQKAKRAISKLIDKLGSDRLGIIIFGGQAYVQLPITTDYSAAKLFLQGINTGMIPTQGTAIGAAIDLALESFDFETQTNKAVIIITDGENHEDDAVASANKAAEKGVTIHTVGMGSINGAPIPIYKGKKQIGYRKDKEGNTIVTKLDEEMLKELSSTGNGSYIRASNANDGISFIYDEINKMEKTEFGSKMFTDYEDRFQFCIGFALLMLACRMLISNGRSIWWSKLNLFNG